MEAILYSLLPLIIIFVIATIGRINNELHDRKYNLAKKIKEERLAREEQEKKKWDIYKKNLERKLKSKQESSRRLSISVNQKDLEECYKIGVSGYILKPLKYDDYVKKIESVLSYWSINELKKY